MTLFIGELKFLLHLVNEKVIDHQLYPTVLYGIKINHDAGRQSTQFKQILD